MAGSFQVERRADLATVKPPRFRGWDAIGQRKNPGDEVRTALGSDVGAQLVRGRVRFGIEQRQRVEAVLGSLRSDGDRVADRWIRA